MTINEKRAYEKDVIMSIVRDHKQLLVDWADIIAACLRGAAPQLPLKLTKVGHFIDGFAIRAPESMSATNLRDLLKQQALDVMPPHP